MDTIDFSEFDKKKEDAPIDYAKMSITFRNVQRLYPGAIHEGVKEFWIDGQGWIQNETKGEVTEQIRAALELGAIKLQLHLRNQKINQDIYSDYHAREITE